ncbi:MAG: hypothetical protein SCH66_11665 [Methanolobus sp.]|nr:hypothetical protein [Methanolobus sp.]
MLNNSFALAMLIAIIALAVTGFASASEDQTVEINCVEKECFEETAWAAQSSQLVGVNRFVDQGNWATYVIYKLGTYVDPEAHGRYPIYAGQTYRTGTLKVYDETTYQSEGECGPGYYGTIYVRYVSSGSEPTYKDGYVGSWNGFTEYHLQVVDEVEGFEAVRTFSNKFGWSNPIPGQFDYSEEYDMKKSYTDWIEVEVCGYDCDVFIAAHSVMQWCGYPVAA